MMPFLFALLLLVIQESQADPVEVDSPPAEETIIDRDSHKMLDEIEQEIERARAEGAFDPPVILPEPPPLEGPEVVEKSLPEIVLESDIGEATHYGGRFHGRKTASGERFDQDAMTAAHRTYPFGTVVRVTNQSNGRSVVLRINDRGPYGPAKKAKRKIIDVSRAAAKELGFYRAGRTVVQVDVLEWGR